MKNMRKILLVSILVVFVLGISLWAIPAVKAVAPTLSVSASGNGDSVQVMVNGDSNSAAYLYYQKVNYGFQSQYIGTTNAYGSLSTTISASAYGISSGASVYTMVNNQQSQSVAWPYGYNYNNGGGSLSLSQTNVTLNVDGSRDVTIYGGNWPYSMNAGSPDIFQAVIGGNTLTITGKSVGSGTLSVCSSGGGCATVYVTVANNGYINNPVIYGAVSFSQNNISVNTGNSATVTIYSNSGSYYNYYVSSNSNSNVASANINGSTLTVYGNNYGSASIVVCQSGGQYSGQCGTLYVSVGYGNNNGYMPTAMTFSQSNPNLSIGQSTTVSIYGGSNVNGNYYSGNYYIGYNSNSSSVQTSLSGSTLTLTGRSNSITVIVVCASTNSCGVLTVTVGQTGTSGNGQNWNFCANENQHCGFSGTKTVRYGVNGSYHYRTPANGVLCSNSVFGDPLFGVTKQCSYSY